MLKLRKITTFAQAIAMKKEDVTHRGVVERTGDNTLTIRTGDDCRCDGCAVTALCNGKDKNGELITINVPDSSRYSVGDRVEITATSTSTLLATWWSLILPTLVLVSVILICRFQFPELGGWSVAIGLGALVLYDLFLYLQRHRLAQKIIWTVNKL